MPKLSKAARKAERRRIRNRAIKSAMKTFIKKAEALIVEGKLPEAEEAVREAIRFIDKAVAKGVIHPNNGARRKSKLMSKLNKLKEEASA